MIIKELFIEDFEYDFVEAISLVENPAIEIDFEKFNSQNIFSISKTDEEKRIVLGPAMIPNKLIIRYDNKSNQEYYVWFSKKTIENISYDFLKNNRIHNSTIEHRSKVNGVYVIESWIIKDPELDKAKSFGFDCPVGTWMVAIKVEDDKIWNNVKAGKLNGFSIEGYFTNKLTKYSTEDTIKSIVYSELSDIEKENLVRKILKIEK